MFGDSQRVYVWIILLVFPYANSVSDDKVGTKKRDQPFQFNRLMQENASYINLVLSSFGSG